MGNRLVQGVNDLETWCGEHGEKDRNFFRVHQQ